MREAAEANGSIGLSISGSGPSVFSFSIDEQGAQKVANAIGDVLKENRVEYDTFVSPINIAGPRVI
jgi:homoserine kinase